MVDTESPVERRKPAVVIVIAIVVVVLVVAYLATRKAPHESEHGAVMASELTSMRTAIETYHTRHAAFPLTLEDLVHDGELPGIPPDPVTRSTTTWKTTIEETVAVDDFTTASKPAKPRGIIDVRSGATGSDPDGKPWNEY